jgi:hypothetical protein
VQNSGKTSVQHTSISVLGLSPLVSFRTSQNFISIDTSIIESRRVECQVCASLFNVNKTKSFEKIKGYQDMQKYKDVILQGANVSGEQLPVCFYKEFDKFLGSYKKIVKAE